MNWTTPERRAAGRRSPLRWLSAVLLLGGFVAAACGDSSDDNGAGATPPATVAASTPTAGGSETPVAEGPSLTDPALQVRTIDGLSAPTQLVFLGPDDLLVSEKTGNVVRVRAGEVEGPVLELAANFADERGVLGLALHPSFAQNNYVYVYWTWTGEGQVPDGLFGEPSDDIEKVPALGNRVDRFTWDGTKLNFDRGIIELPSRTTDLTIDRRRGNHNAGVIKFGPDGKLYVIIGDQNDRGPLQNVVDGPLRGENDGPNGVLTGAVLRLNDDGTTPADNPFANYTPQPSWAQIFIYGIRNGFGYDWDPQSGKFWIEVNGQAAYDQIGQYDAGNNIGWIQTMGPTERHADWKALELDTDRLLDNPAFPPSELADTSEEALSRLMLLPGAAYKEPQFAWKYAVAPTALEFIDGSALGPEYTGTFVVGDVNTGTIYRFELTADRSQIALEGALADRVNDNTKDDPIGEMKDHVFGTGFLVLTDIENGPDGSLWVSSIPDGALYQITRGAAQ